MGPAPPPLPARGDEVGARTQPRRRRRRREYEARTQELDRKVFDNEELSQAESDAWCAWAGHLRNQDKKRKRKEKRTKRLPKSSSRFSSSRAPCKSGHYFSALAAGPVLCLGVARDAHVFWFLVGDAFQTFPFSALLGSLDSHCPCVHASVHGGMWRNSTHFLRLLVKWTSRCVGSYVRHELDHVAAAGFGTESGTDYWKVYFAWQDELPLFRHFQWYELLEGFFRGTAAGVRYDVGPRRPGQPWCVLTAT